MSVVKFDKFGGMLPSVDDRLLPETAGAYSRDAYLYTGTLIGWRLPTQVFNLVNATTRMAYRIPQDETRPGVAELSYWLEFADVNTNVIRTPVINDSFERYYYASPSVRPKYNTLARIAASLPAWFLGVPAPANAPGVSPSGGSGAGLASARSYVYTYVTAYGEESAPSAPLVQNGFVDDTWVVTMTPPVSGDQGTDRNITTMNIYRTVVGTNGTASFFLVANVPVATTTYNDSLTDAVVALNVTLPSTTWTQPPVDLQGITMGANGMMVGFRANEIWFSEPFRPHTFPSVYTITTEFPIVGLGVCGEAIVVITKGYPVVLTGVNPSSISANVIKRAEPCYSRGSIVSASDAVFFIGNNGLMAVSPYGTMVNITEKWITRDKWLALVTGAGAGAMRSTMSFSDAYFSFGAVFVDPATGLDNATYAQAGFTINSPATGAQTYSAPTGANVANPAFGLMSAPNALDIYNVMTDHWTGHTLLIQNQKVYYYHYADPAPVIMPYKWTSRIIQEGHKRNYEVMRVWFTVPASTPTQNVTRNTATPQSLASDQYAILRVYADGALWTTRELRTSGELLRINSGGKFEFWQFEIEGRVEIYNMQVATNVQELANK